MKDPNSSGARRPPGIATPNLQFRRTGQGLTMQTSQAIKIWEESLWPLPLLRSAKKELIQALTAKVTGSVVSEPSDQDELEKAILALEAAESKFNALSCCENPQLLDAVIFELNSAECRVNALHRALKQE